MINSCPNEAIALGVKHLLEADICYLDGSPVSRRAFIILKDKLDKLNNSANIQDDLIDALKRFKTEFLCHHM